MADTKTDPLAVSYDDIPDQARSVLNEIHGPEVGDAASWWNARNRMFGNIRPRDVWRTGAGGETRVMTVLNMIADGNF